MSPSEALGAYLNESPQSMAVAEWLGGWAMPMRRRRRLPLHPGVNSRPLLVRFLSSGAYRRSAATATTASSMPGYAVGERDAAYEVEVGLSLLEVGSASTYMFARPSAIASSREDHDHLRRRSRQVEFLGRLEAEGFFCARATAPDSPSTGRPPSRGPSGGAWWS